MAKTPQIFETSFDTYTNIGVIGDGGAGRVFKVTNTSGEHLALKCLHADRVTTAKQKRFKNEIDFCSKRQHKNLIQVADHGLVEWEGKKTPFYVMPLYPRTLRDLLHDGIQPDHVLPLFGQMLDGVETAHLVNVIHRDLKPENILFDPNLNTVVIADFGIAHFEEDMIFTAVETKDTERLANLRYSAPEQRTKGAKVDKRADIFALGLMLNEMFTRDVPQGAGYRSISTVSNDYAYLDSIVEKMIQHAPESRQATIDEIKKELIGRKNEFIARQQLDFKRQEVIPAGKPQQIAPIKLVDVDWKPNTLTLTLNRVPETEWVIRFRNPTYSYRALSGARPENFEFSGNTAVVHANENGVQQIIDHFKTYLERTTEIRQSELDQLADKQERDAREELKRQVKAAEARERVLKNVKI